MLIKLRDWEGISFAEQLFLESLKRYSLKYIISLLLCDLILPLISQRWSNHFNLATIWTATSYRLVISVLLRFYCHRSLIKVWIYWWEIDLFWKGTIYSSGVTSVEINSSIQETSQFLRHLNQIEKIDSNIFRLPGTLWRPQIPFGSFSWRELSGPCSTASEVAAST